MEGIDRLLKDIEKMKREQPKKVDKFLINQGNRLLGLTKERTPVDTGTLRNSWFMKKEKEQVIVYNLTEYANDVEFGTKDRYGAFMLTRSIKILDKYFEENFKNFFKGGL